MHEEILFHDRPLPAQPMVVIQPVSVTDIRMSFGSMVVFMIKWAFAAIPAMIVVFTVVAFIAFVLSLIFGAALSGLGGLMSAPKPSIH